MNYYKMAIDSCCPWAYIKKDETARDVVRAHEPRLRYLQDIIQDWTKNHSDLKSDWPNINQAISHIIAESPKSTVLYVINALPEVYNSQIMEVLDMCLIFPDTYNSSQIKDIIQLFGARDALKQVDYIYVNY